MSDYSWAVANDFANLGLLRHTGMEGFPGLLNICLCFTAEFPLAHLLQPFRDYYLQAEHSVAALIQIR